MMPKYIRVVLTIMAMIALALAFSIGTLTFSYHSGSIAASPGETLPLDFYYKDSGIAPSRIEVISLVGENSENLDVLSYEHRRGILPNSIGIMEIQLRMVAEGKGVINAVVVDYGGEKLTLPVGHIEWLSESIEVDEPLVAMKKTTVAMPRKDLIPLSVPLTREARIGGADKNLDSNETGGCPCTHLKIV